MTSIPVIILFLVISLCFGALVNIVNNYDDPNDIKVDLNTDSAWAFEEKSDERDQKKQLTTTNFDNIFDDLLGYNDEFLITPVATIGFLNQAFKSSWSLK